MYYFIFLGCWLRFLYFTFCYSALYLNSECSWRYSDVCFNLNTSLGALIASLPNSQTHSSFLLQPESTRQTRKWPHCLLLNAHNSDLIFSICNIMNITSRKWTYSLPYITDDLNCQCHSVIRVKSKAIRFLIPFEAFLCYNYIRSDCK